MTSFYLYAVIPAKGNGACFATPVFTSSSPASNGYWAQDIGSDNNIRSFISVEVSENKCIRRASQHLTTVAGEEAIYAFVRPDGTVFVGRRRALIDSLRAYFNSLKEHPFLQKTVANFIGDDLLQLMANNNISDHQAVDLGGFSLIHSRRVDATLERVRRESSVRSIASPNLLAIAHRDASEIARVAITEGMLLDLEDIFPGAREEATVMHLAEFKLFYLERPLALDKIGIHELKRLIDDNVHASVRSSLSDLMAAWRGEAMPLRALVKLLGNAQELEGREPGLVDLLFGESQPDLFRKGIISVAMRIFDEQNVLKVFDGPRSRDRLVLAVKRIGPPPASARRRASEGRWFEPRTLITRRMAEFLFDKMMETWSFDFTYPTPDADSVFPYPSTDETGRHYEPLFRRYYRGASV